MNDYSRITALYAVFPWGMRTGTVAGAVAYRNMTGFVKDKFSQTFNRHFEKFAFLKMSFF